MHISKKLHNLINDDFLIFICHELVVDSFFIFDNLVKEGLSTNYRYGTGLFKFNNTNYCNINPTSLTSMDRIHHSMKRILSNLQQEKFLHDYITNYNYIYNSSKPYQLDQVHYNLDQLKDYISDLNKLVNSNDLFKSYVFKIQKLKFNNTFINKHGISKTFRYIYFIELEFYLCKDNKHRLFILNNAVTNFYNFNSNELINNLLIEFDQMDTFKNIESGYYDVIIKNQEFAKILSYIRDKLVIGFSDNDFYHKLKNTIFNKCLDISFKDQVSKYKIISNSKFNGILSEITSINNISFLDLYVNSGHDDYSTYLKTYEGLIITDIDLTDGFFKLESNTICFSCTAKYFKNKKFSFITRIKIAINLADFLKKVSKVFNDTSTYFNDDNIFNFITYSPSVSVRNIRIEHIYDFGS